MGSLAVKMEDLQLDIKETNRKIDELRRPALDLQTGSQRWLATVAEADKIMSTNEPTPQLRNGLGSVTDKDEHGHTILHPIVWLVLLLVPVYSHVAEEIGALLQFVEMSGVDRDAIPWTNRIPSCERCNFQFYQWGRLGCFRLRPQVTAAEKARDVLALFMADLGQTPVPFRNFLSGMSSGEFEDQQTQIDDTPYSMELGTRARRSIRDALIAKSLESKILCFQGSLARIVVTRNLSRLRQALADQDWESQTFGHRNLSVLDLAVGWPEGLRAFSGAWRKDVISAIGLAVLESDRSSLEILCEPSMFPNPIKAPDSATNTEIPKFTGLLLVNGETRDILIDLLKRQRLDLARLARKYLSTDELTNLELSGSGLLDTKALSVYNFLEERSIPVDSNLHPGFESSIYHAVVSRSPVLTVLNGKDSLLLLEGLHALFVAGFWEMDAQDGDGHTPLERLVSQGEIYRTILVAPFIWFLKTGASPVFRDQGPRQPLLLGLASVLSRTEWDSECTCQALKLVQYTAGRCQPCESDDCVCYCSEDGCLPVHFLVWDWPFPIVIDEDERDRVWDDDAELASQLELLVEAYRGSLDLAEFSQ
ncbi:hypothetical protein QBC38DRAFT_544781 [Podospora fimiseda]|uniref:Uncharacterized protein n=1 Tax=Podospora fimiseda TaxID=252190 RepID=A0AAN7BQQ2_9PEZI|nr:hypothetical protein QBC38DRAFT_544781 [Podospora fimiseda]